MKKTMDQRIADEIRHKDPTLSIYSDNDLTEALKGSFEWQSLGLRIAWRDLVREVVKAFGKKKKGKK